MGDPRSPKAEGARTGVSPPTVTPVLVAELLAEGERMPVYVHVIDHPDARVLVDTGMTQLHPAVADMDPRVIPLSAQADFDLASIDVVINTHLHFDHAGNNFQFTDATFFAQRDHYEHARTDARFPNQYWNLPGLRYELLDGGGEILPGVEIVPTPGHAPGHQSVLLHLDRDGDLVICGDAIYLQDNRELDNWEAMADPAQARESARRLAELEAGGARLLYGHDPAQVALFPRAPHRYR